MVMGKANYIPHPINKFNGIAVSKTFSISKIVGEYSWQRFAFGIGHIKSNWFLVFRKNQTLWDRNIRVDKSCQFFYLIRNTITNYLGRIGINLDCHPFYTVNGSFAASSKIVILPQSQRTLALEYHLRIASYPSHYASPDVSWSTLITA